MRLTKPMRETLELARKQELRRVHDGNGSPPGPHINTLNALVRHELLAASERRTRRGHRLQAWTITDAGRQALQPREIHRTEELFYLNHTGRGAGDYTNDRTRAADDVPVLDPDTLHSAWRQRAEQRKAAAEDPRERARRLARAARRAA